LPTIAAGGLGWPRASRGAPPRGVRRERATVPFAPHRMSFLQGKRLQVWGPCPLGAAMDTSAERHQKWWNELRNKALALADDLLEEIRRRWAAPAPRK
jgi:hypothetical protein